MKTNEDLQRDVQNAIKWEPLLNAAEIGVTAKDGIVTLTGTVNGYMKKSQAEDAAKPAPTELDEQGKPKTPPDSKDQPSVSPGPDGQ